jgi:putative addiction module component (TIGR02574 family)
MTFDDLESEALKLPVEDRAKLLHALMLSLDAEDEPHSDHDRLWSEEIERRCRAIDEGRARLVPADEVFARAEAALARHLR